MIPNYLSTAWATDAPALGNHLWQSTLFVVLAGLLTLVLRKNQAGARYWLWLAASVKFLIPFSLLVSIGSHMATPRALAEVQPSMFLAMGEVSHPFIQPTLSVIVPATSTGHLGFVHLFPAILLTAWLCGFIVVLSLWCVRWRRISASLLEAVSLRQGREVEALRRLEHIAGVQKRIKLLLSKASIEPGIFGIARPVLVWPEKISERLSDAQLEAILTHEICHVRRRDNLTAAIHMIVEAIFWFHPLVWWLGVRLLEERERACDEEVLCLYDQPRTYAESILKVCEFCVESPLVCVSGITGANLNRRLRSIMTLRVERLSRSKKLLLSALGLIAVLAPVTFGMVQINPAYAQILYTAGPRPSFEVATIKPSKPDENQFIEIRDGYYTAKHISLRKFVKFAYGIKLDDQLVGGPNWMDKEFFDIEAKAGPSEVESIKKLGPLERIDQFNLMLQSLLEDRFQLKVSSKTQELPAYALVVAKGGPRLKAVTVSPEVAALRRAPAPPPPPPPGEGSAPGHREPPGGPFPGIRKSGTNQVTATALRMNWFADWLLHQGEIGNRVVVDRTGLKGNYDFVLDGISVDPSALPGATPTPSDEFTVSIFTALQQQLGLKLIPTKAPVEVLVVDHVEQPSEN